MMLVSRRTFFLTLAGALLTQAAPTLEILDEAEREPDYITYWLFRMNEALASNDMDTALAAATEFKAAIEDEEIPLEWRDWYQGISRVI